MPFCFFNSAKCLVEGAADVSARHWDCLVVDRQQRLLKGTIVVGQRTLKKCLSRERHQPKAAMAVAMHEVENGEFGSLQSAGRDVGREHAARAIQREYNIMPKEMAGIRLLTPLRPGEGQAYSA